MDETRQTSLGQRSQIYDWVKDETKDIYKSLSNSLGWNVSGKSYGKSSGRATELFHRMLWNYEYRSIDI